MDDTSYATPPGASGPAAPPPGPLAAGPGRPRAARSRTDRKLAGVCGGLGAYYGIDPLILRVLVVVLTIFGGSGLLLYLAGWLLLPDEHEEHSEVDRLLGRDHNRGPSVATVLVAGILVIVAASLALGAVFGRRWWFGPDLWPLIVIGGVVALIWYVHRDSRPPVAVRAAYPPPAPYPPAGPPGYGPGGTGTGAYPAGYTPAAAPQPAPWTADPEQYYAPPTGQGPQPYPYGQSYTPTAAAQGAPYGTDTPTLVDLPAGAGSAGPPPTPWAGPAGPSGPPTPPVVRQRSVLGALTWWAGLLAAGVMLLGNRAGVWHLTAVTFLAVLLAVVGAGLVVGAFAGRSRGLIVLGIALSVLTAAVSAVPAVGSARAGNANWAPASLAAVPANGYDLAAGRATLDLTASAFTQVSGGGQIQADVGVGRLLVIVPSGVHIVLHATVGIGSVVTPDGARQDGIGHRTLDAEYGPPAGATVPTLTLRLDVGAGVVEVRYAQA